MTNIKLYKGDIPGDLSFGDSVAVDCEMMGLDLHRDRLCLVQLGDGKGNAYLVQIIPNQEYPNLKKLLSNEKVLKIFHYARMDVAKILNDLGVMVRPLYCTKIASKLSRTYTSFHGLKNVCYDLLGITLSKEQQTSDWGAKELSEEQMQYAAADVLYLHALKSKLDELLKREGRYELAQECFDFLGTRAKLDLLSFDEPDIFAHH